MSVALFRILAEASIRSTIVALLVGALLAMLRLRSSAVRHSAWTAVVLVMLAMPLLDRVTLPIAIPLPISDASARVSFSVSSGPLDQPKAFANPREGGLVQAPGAVTEPRVQSLTTPITRRPTSPVAALMAAYLAGLAIMVMRLAIGWRTISRVTRSSRSVEGNIRESPAVVTPMTAGTLRPTILLPTNWRSWPADKLQAVLAHEMAHVSRRDPLIAFLATINRCVFWFHPLAWWLERAIRSHAEHAADSTAISTMAEPQRYAEVLLDMARSVREQGSRLSRHALGMRGDGLLSERIDRVLESSQPEPTAGRTLTLAAGCLLAIVVAIACRPAPPAFLASANPSIEDRDRALRLNLERTYALRALDRFDPDITPARVEALESIVDRDPDNLGAVRELLSAYWQSPPVEKRRRIVLQSIERHPESDLAGSIDARLFPTDLEDSFPGDPIGYDTAKALWLAQVGRADVTPQMLGNASYFFEAVDKPLAESMLLKAKALDPTGPWSARLGRFYAIVLTGVGARSGRNRTRLVSQPEPRTAYGVLTRQKLGESRDDVLLTAAGWVLVRSYSRMDRQMIDSSFWAESCFRRAIEVQPSAVLAHSELVDLQASLSWRRGEALWTPPPDRRYETVAALPDRERFAQLPHLAIAAYIDLEGADRWDDQNLKARQDIARQQAKQYAEDVLSLAPRFRAQPNYGTAIYLANVTLGALALREADTRKAIAYLNEASRAPASEELAYSESMVSGVAWRVSRILVENGQRDAVVAFLERMATLNIARRYELRVAAEAVRRGEALPRI